MKAAATRMQMMHSALQLSPFEWSSAVTFVQVERQLLAFADESDYVPTQSSVPPNLLCAARQSAASVAAKVQAFAAEVSAHVQLVMRPSTALENVRPVIAGLLVMHEHLLMRLLDRNP